MNIKLYIHGIKIYTQRLCSFLELCENLVCKNATDTCSDGSCHCGSSSSLVCDVGSEFPLCSNGSCVCSKVNQGYGIGDGTSQGSCTSTLHKCQSNGKCVECSYDSQCTELSNKCVNGICVCGGLSRPCNSTSSNTCNVDGECRCGENPECHTSLHVIEVRSDGVNECSKYKCSWDRIHNDCKQQRGPEVCAKITKYYNPLFLEGQTNSDSTPVDVICDDEKGKHLGTYQCLGNIYYM